MVFAARSLAFGQRKLQLDLRFVAHGEPDFVPCAWPEFLYDVDFLLTELSATQTSD